MGVMHIHIPGWVSHEWVAACMQAAGTHHNVTHGCDAGGNGSDGHQRRQCNVEDLEWGRHCVPLELQRTQDKLHELISIRPAAICGGSTAGLGFRGVGQLFGIVQCKMSPFSLCTAKGRFCLSTMCSARGMMPVRTRLFVFSQPASLKFECAEYKRVSAPRKAKMRMVQISHPNAWATLHIPGNCNTVLGG